MTTVVSPPSSWPSALVSRYTVRPAMAVSPASNGSPSKSASSKTRPEIVAVVCEEKSRPLYVLPEPATTVYAPAGMSCTQPPGTT